MKAEQIASHRLTAKHLDARDMPSTAATIHNLCDEIERLQAFDEAKEREKFEAWQTRRDLDVSKFADGGYCHFATSIAWQSWLASAKASKGVTT